MKAVGTPPFSHPRWPPEADKGQVNIFSHLFGAALFFALPFILYRELGQRYATASKGDTIVFAVYLFGVAICFILSVIFHTFMSHSAQAFAFGIQLDFQGIILLMWSATAPMVYYTFYTEPNLQRLYWSLVRHCRLS
jgi:adiponectin receptor